MTLPELSQSLRLILITDRHVIREANLYDAIEPALEAGLPAMILREKDLSDDELLPIAEKLREMTHRTGTLFLINRRYAIAKKVRADGVHLGASGPTLEEVRRSLGPKAIIGYSSHRLEESIRAFGKGANYVTCSPVFDTPGKRGILKTLGLTELEKWVKTCPGPVVALGGIDETNIESATQTGAAGVAVIRAIMAAEDTGAATAILMNQIRAKR